MEWDEEMELNQSLDDAWHYYFSIGNWDCMQRVYEARNALGSHMFYMGKTAWTGVTYDGRPYEIKGSYDPWGATSGIGSGARVISPSTWKALGSMNDVVNTVIHENFHASDARIHTEDWKNGLDPYDPEPPANQAQAQCTI